MYLLPRAEILCPLSVLERVRTTEVFLGQMYENFVGTQETVRNREVSVPRGSTVVEVYKKVGKSVIEVCQKTLKGQQAHFIVVKKTPKLPGFVVVYSHLQDGTFTTVKRVATF